MKKKTKEYKIHVAVRLRPLMESEDQYDELVSCVDDNTILISKGKTQSRLSFDRFFGKEDNQQAVFGYMRDIVLSVMSGYNVTIFAYGQTGTGKTYTMMGLEFDNLDENLGLYLQLKPPDELPVNYAKFNNLKGIIPRAVDALITSVEDSPVQYNVYCSFLEIYNEKLFDLLDYDGRETNLEIRETREQRIYVPKLTMIRINEVEDIYNIIREGTYNRAVGVTDMNERSSRSHTIFQVYVESKAMDGTTTLSKLNLVDLAGSEKWNTYSKTKMSDEKILELTSINKSLSTLGKCIFQLRKGNSHIPYRESKLTRLLQDSLGGNTKTAFIATISSSELAFEETISTLKFAVRAMKVIVNTSVNEVVDERVLLKRYKVEVAKLRETMKEKDELIRDLEKQNGVMKEQLDMALPFMKFMGQQSSDDPNNNNNNLEDMKVMNEVQVKRVLDVVLLQRKEMEKKMLRDIHKLRKKLDDKRKNLGTCKMFIKKMKEELDFYKSKMKLEVKKRITDSPLLRDRKTARGITGLLGEELEDTGIFGIEDDLDEQKENEIIFREVKDRAIKGLTGSVETFRRDINTVLKEHLKEIIIEPLSSPVKGKGTASATTISDEKVEMIEEELEMLVEGCCDALEESVTGKQKKHLEVLFGLVKERSRKIAVRKEERGTQTIVGKENVFFDSEDASRRVRDLIGEHLKLGLVVLERKARETIVKKKEVSISNLEVALDDDEEEDGEDQNNNNNNIGISRNMKMTEEEDEEVMKYVLGQKLFDLYVEKKESIRDTQSKILVATSVLRKCVKRILVRLLANKKKVFKKKDIDGEESVVTHHINMVEEKLKFLKKHLKEFQRKSFLRDKNQDVPIEEQSKIRKHLILD